MKLFTCVYINAWWELISYYRNEQSNYIFLFWWKIIYVQFIRTIYAPIAEDFRLETYQVGNVARRNFEWVETSGGWECLALSCTLPCKNGVGLLVAKVTGIFHCTFSISQCNKLASFTCRACTKWKVTNL